MAASGGQGHDEDPFGVLGLEPGADPAQIAAARRRLARTAHPDVGGSHAGMQRVNDAAAAAMLVATASPTEAPMSFEMSSRAASPDARRRRRPDPSSAPASRHDHPSFTVEALPAEAFEGLVIVASWLGDVIDDDPPYVLDVALTEPLEGWCRLTVVPDAGSSTVGLDVGGVPGGPAPSVDAVRDAFVDGLNRLDWDDLDRQCSAPGPLPPC